MWSEVPRPCRLYDCNTCFHLAEYRCRFAPLKGCTRTSPIDNDGRPKWVEYDDIYWYGDDFSAIGLRFEEATDSVIRGTVGKAESRLFSLRRAVDFAVDWMNANRTVNRTVNRQLD